MSAATRPERPSTSNSTTADDTLRVRIRDNGPGPAGEAASGHGLRGMQERAATVGGSLRVATAPAGGFLVEATLPVSKVDT